VHEQIKDVHDRPYLPGSSLKGALRTVLAWGLYASRKRQPDLSRLGRSRSWASQPLERELFGRDPNHDWLRALQVEDSQPVAADEHLELRTARVYPTATGDSPGLNVDVEAVKRGTALLTALTVEEYGFDGRAARQLGWQDKRRWIDRLPALAREHARQRLLTEAEYFQPQHRPAGVRRFYHHLINEVWSKLASNELIVQIGWGGGWESKTLGSGMLRSDDQLFERLLGRYRMTKEQNRRPGDPFPKSRHLALDSRGRPVMPMGWVVVRLEGL
jgi:CRISPR-associated protein Csm5